MATIYTKESEKVCILAARELMLREFDFGAWTEMRMGLFFGDVANTGDNTAGANESVSLASVSDRIWFGIKDPDTTVLPGETGATFLGATTRTGDVSRVEPANGGIGSFGGGALRALSAVGAHDTTLVGASASEALEVMILPNSSVGSSNYNGFFGLKFTVNNIGTSSQTVDITSSTVTNPALGTDYSLDALRTLLVTFGNPSTTRNIAWNTGAAARAIPTAWFVRVPFYSNRLRMSSVCMIKIA